jgi:hypothetical protein
MFQRKPLRVPIALVRHLLYRQHPEYISRSPRMFCWYKKSEWQREHCASAWAQPFLGENNRKWEPWFAWYPVTHIGYSPFGWFCWLKWVWRCDSGILGTSAIYFYNEYPPTLSEYTAKLPYFGGQ